MANLEGGESMHVELSPGDAERRPIPPACSLESTGACTRRQDADDAKMTAADEKTRQRARTRTARKERRGSWGLLCALRGAYSGSAVVCGIIAAWPCSLPCSSMSCHTVARSIHKRRPVFA